MAGKRKAKKKSKQDSARKGRQPKRQPETLPPMPDWRAVEGALWHAMPPSAGEETPLDKAQQIMYEAFETANPRKAVALAQEALQVCPDCADAYVLLAQYAPTLDKALHLLGQGVAAGERVLGERTFREYAGEFWGLLETRPYMRARRGLAECLWAVGRREEAVAHYQDMLRLNPNDNQGVRYLLASCLLEMERHQDLEQLLHQYEDDASAEWAYARALLAFRLEGDSERARRALQEARETNQHVPAYLTNANLLPRELPEYVSPGREDEAVCLAAQFLAAWKNTPGAVAWVRKTLKVPLSQPTMRGEHWRQVKPRLSALRQVEGEVWEVDVRSLSSSYYVGKAPPEGWAVLVVDTAEDELVGFEVSESRPTAGETWDCLVDVMCSPEEGEPHRPQQVVVRLKTLHKAWRSKLEQVGVDCVLRPELEHVDCVLGELLAETALDDKIEQIMAPLSDEELRELDELPQQIGETWQADARPMLTWMTVEDVPVRPWAILVANVDEDLILNAELCPEPPDDEALWRCLLKAFLRPAAGRPHRPGILQVASQQQLEAVGEKLATAGIECRVSTNLPLLDTMFEELGKRFAAPAPRSSLLNSPGVTPQVVGRFFDAAAGFYRRAPWRKLTGDVPIKIECDKFQNGTWYAVVMGQSGMTQGLAMYEDPALLREVLSGDLDEEQSARRTSGLGLTFGEAFEIAVQDLDAAEKHHWPVAGPEAYPSAFRVNPGLALRTPLAWELELLEGCLRAIPEFVAAGSVPWSGTVPAASGVLPLRLSWYETG